MDFLKQQDAADPDFIPSEKDEKRRLEQGGEKIRRLHFLNYNKESARRKAITKRYLAKIKKDLEEKNKK